MVETSSFNPALADHHRGAIESLDSIRDGKGSRKLSDFAISAVALFFPGLV